MGRPEQGVIQHDFFDGRRRTVWEHREPQAKEELRALHERTLGFLRTRASFLELYMGWVVHGFVPKRSPLTHVRVHRNAGSMLKIDLFRAFERTGREKVLTALQDLKAPKELVADIARLAFLGKLLPPGFSTSPVLFNIAVFPMDRKLVAFARERKYRYSRYGDDLAFSTQERYVPQKDIDAIREIIAEHGYDSHKISLGHPSEHPVRICGVSVFEGRTFMAGPERLKIRAGLHNALLEGNMAKFWGLLGHVVHIDGRVSSGIKKYYRIAKRLRSGELKF